MTETRKLAAIMFTDIAGYTAIMADNEKRALAILSRNRAVQKEAVGRFKGEMIKEMGDGFLSIFSSSVDAVHAAMEMQKQLSEESDFQIRIGIHVGDIRIQDGDVFGDGVNVASRIQGAGEPGGIIITEKVYDDIKNQKAIRVDFLGQRQFKHVRGPVKAYSVHTGEMKEKDNKKNVKSPGEQDEKSIIVLPFVNISPDPDQEYFADGLTEEVITDLSHIQDLLVISRSSAMTLKGTKKSIPEIARSVQVTHVLEGSVRKSGNHLRITAQLIDAEGDVHLWSEKYSGTLDDIFDIQEKVSQRIVEALKGRLSKEEKQQLAPRMSSSGLGVYDAYTRANYMLWTYEPGSHERALKLLEDALDVFGEHPLLLSGIGAIHWQFYHQLGDVDEQHLVRVRECVDKLFDDDPDSAPGHRLKSYLLLHEGDTAGALAHLKSALEGDPGDTETLLWTSYLLAIHAGRPDLARPLAEKWVAVDPLHPISSMCIYLSEWMAGDMEDAVQGLEEWTRKDPDNPITRFYLGHVLAWNGRVEESLAVAEKMYRQDPDEYMGRALRFVALALSGRKKEARNALPSRIKEAVWMDFHLPWLVAEGYAVLGETDEAIRWLERSFEKGIFNYPLFNDQDPLLAGIRGEKRFKNLMDRVKVEWKNFKFGF